MQRCPAIAPAARSPLTICRGECVRNPLALIQIDPVVVTGPYGYWLDISTERLARSRVVHFARWLQQLAGAGQGRPLGSHAP